MARSNKYASVNFNEIYGPKKPSPSPTSHTNSSLPANRTHGRMLILTRPTNPQPTPTPTPTPTPAPAPIPIQTQTPTPTQPPPAPPEKPADPVRRQLDSISLRPLGRTDLLHSYTPTLTPTSTTASAASPIAVPIKEFKESQPLTSPKPEPFVPPHLRPGFAGREDRLEQEGQRQKQGFRSRDKFHSLGQGHGQEQEYSSPNGRPSSGGGREGMSRGGSDLDGNQPSSGGNRPGSSGWNGSYRPHPF